MNLGALLSWKKRNNLGFWVGGHAVLYCTYAVSGAVPSARPWETVLDCFHGMAIGQVKSVPKQQFRKVVKFQFLRSVLPVGRSN
jgi:hypothetical protein